MSRTLLALAFIGCGLSAAASNAFAANTAQVIFFNTNDQRHSFVGYSAEFGVALDASVTDATNVVVAHGTDTYDLVQETDGWYRKFQNPTLSGLKTAFDGIWQVQVVRSGNPTGYLNFTLGLSGLMDTNFPSMPTITNPTHGSSVAPGPATIQWTNPNTPGYAASDLRFANLDTNFGGGYQEYDFPADVYSWNVNLLNNEYYDLEIDYAAYLPSSMVTDLSSSGLTWGTSIYAPLGWPEGYPLVAAVSTHRIGFAVPEPTSLSILGIAGILLGRRCRH